MVQNPSPHIPKLTFRQFGSFSAANLQRAHCALSGDGRGMSTAQGDAGVGLFLHLRLKTYGFRAIFPKQTNPLIKSIVIMFHHFPN